MQWTSIQEVAIMSPDKRKEILESSDIGRQEALIARMKAAMDRLAEGLPLFDPKEFDSAVEAAKACPNVALRGLCRRLSAKDAATREVAAWVLGEIVAPPAADRLKAMVFDELAPAMARAQAAEFLSRIGEPVDPDMLEMSLPNAPELLASLPARVVEDVQAGDLDSAARRFAGLEPPAQAVLIHRLVAEAGRAAVPFCERVAEGDDFAAEAALSAVSAQRLPEAAELVGRLAKRECKKVRKLARTVKYELESAGIAVPGSCQRRAEDAAERREERATGTRFYKAMISEPQPDGAVFACAAVEKPTGKLKALSLVVDPWRGGIESAAYRQDMTKSSFARTLKRWQREMRLQDVGAEEIRALASRGLAVSKALDSRIPVDFQLGKEMFGDVDEQAAALGSPFRCEGCGAALGEEEIARLKDAAIYPHVKVEKRCKACRDAGGA